jgi:hypothetical protein
VELLQNLTESNEAVHNTRAKVSQRGWCKKYDHKHGHVSIAILPGTSCLYGVHMVVKQDALL